MSNETPTSNGDTLQKEPPKGDPISAVEPGKTLIEVMGRRLVVALAIGSVVGATMLCLLGIFSPTSVPSQISRFFLCLLTAFLFSVFSFTLYPSHYTFNIGEIIKVPFVLIGPAALWIALFLVFWYLLPAEHSAGYLFTQPTGTDQLPYSNTWVLNWTPTQPSYYQLKLSNDQYSDDANILAGFYLVFDAAHDQYSAEVGVGAAKDEIERRYEVTFSRGESTYKLRPLERR